MASRLASTAMRDQRPESVGKSHLSVNKVLIPDLKSLHGRPRPFPRDFPPQRQYGFSVGVAFEPTNQPMPISRIARRTPCLVAPDNRSGVLLGSFNALLTSKSRDT